MSMLSPLLLLAAVVSVSLVVSLTGGFPHGKNITGFSSENTKESGSRTRPGPILVLVPRPSVGAFTRSYIAYR